MSCNRGGGPTFRVPCEHFPRGHDNRHNQAGPSVEDGEHGRTGGPATPDTISGASESCAMVAREQRHWRTLERWSPTLFLLGGGGVITHAAIQALEAFTTVNPPADVFVTTGHLIALAGLLGLYPALAGRTPRLARVGLAATGLGVAAWTVMTAMQFLSVAGAVGSLTSSVPGAFFVVVIAVTVLAYTLVGAAALHADAGRTMDGLLVLAPAALLLALIGKSVVAGVGAADGAVIGGGLAFAMLALGVRLQSWPGVAVEPASAGAASG